MMVRISAERGAGTASSISPPSDSRMTRQPDHRMFDRDERREHRVEDRPARRDGEDDADDDPDRGHDVGEEVPPVGGERRRAPLRPCGDQYPAQAALMTLARALSARPGPARRSSAAGRTAPQASRRMSSAATMISAPAQHRAEVLDLVVTVGVVRSAAAAASRTAMSAAIAVATLTRLSSASE